MISAKVVANSVNEFGHEICTMVVTMPRYILAEFNTHRMFSRNSASSRAIPFKKMLKSIRENPFIPYAWQEDHSGMQGTRYLPEIPTMQSEQEWRIAMAHASVLAEQLNDRDVTKQLCNRLLEPFMWHTVLVTSTEWENFFKLRCPEYELPIHPTQVFRSRKDAIRHHNYPELHDRNDLFWLSHNRGQADIHMMFLAEAMWDAYQESKPKLLKAGEWYIPFGSNIDLGNPLLYTTKNKNKDHFIDTMSIVKIATARCARTSYNDFEGNSNNYEKDILLHDRLKESGHWSPFEHCAKAMSKEDLDNYLIIENGKVFPGYCRNFQGFIQYRAMIDRK